MHGHRRRKKKDTCFEVHLYIKPHRYPFFPSLFVSFHVLCKLIHPFMGFLSLSRSEPVCLFFVFSLFLSSCPPACMSVRLLSFVPPLLPLSMPSIHPFIHPSSVRCSTPFLALSLRKNPVCGRRYLLFAFKCAPFSLIPRLRPVPAGTQLDPVTRNVGRHRER